MKAVMNTKTMMTNIKKEIMKAEKKNIFQIKTKTSMKNIQKDKIHLCVHQILKNIFKNIKKIIIDITIIIIIIMLMKQTTTTKIITKYHKTSEIKIFIRIKLSKIPA